MIKNINGICDLEIKGIKAEKYENCEYTKTIHYLQGRANKRGKVDYRSPYQRDVGAIIHSSKFRRLEGKSQVYMTPHDAIRNRLTHSLEVSELAESIYIFLNNKYKYKIEESSLDRDAIKAVALLHDIGHPPFGHKGEEALNKILQEKTGNSLKFEGNAQNFHMICNDDVLNLTARVKIGILKYNLQDSGEKKFNVYKEDYKYFSDLIKDIEIDFDECKKGKKFKYQTFDSKIMELADDIAYVTHDLEDALNVQLLKWSDLEEVIKKNKELKEEKEIDEDNFRSKLIGYFIKEITIGQEVGFLNPSIDLSYEARKLMNELKYISEEKYIKSREVQMAEYNAEEMIKYVFEAFDSNHHLFEAERKKELKKKDKDKEKDEYYRYIADYISGMTDAYIMYIYERLKGTTKYSLRHKV